MELQAFFTIFTRKNAKNIAFLQFEVCSLQFEANVGREHFVFRTLLILLRRKRFALTTAIYNLSFIIYNLKR